MTKMFLKLLLNDDKHLRVRQKLSDLSIDVAGNIVENVAGNDLERSANVKTEENNEEDLVIETS
jgi:hypothetical protein